jgi:hypothetical protein
MPRMSVRFSMNSDEACQVNLQYHSRNNVLTPSDKIIMLLQYDVKTRAKQSLVNLKNME